MGVGVLNYAFRQALVKDEGAGVETKVVFAVGGRLSERQPRKGSAGTQGSLRFSTPHAAAGYTRCRAEATGKNCTESLERRHAVLKQHVLSACPRAG
jgi:hypothetical protein